jgi:hypothetical protein
MTLTTATQSIFQDWKPEHSELWGQENLLLKHNLDQHPLLQEDALAHLIDTVPLAHYNINKMGMVNGKKEWREGCKGDLSGADVIKAIKAGRIWINLRRLHEADKRYADLLNEIYAEIDGRVPELKSFKHNLGILISSPNAQVYYHCDVPGQSLWQIKGKKRVYVYPAHAPFLQQEMMEGIIVGDTEEEGMRYEPWFDDYAQIYDLEPGQMLHWPLNGPHRVENMDCLNISITTEHWSEEIRNSYGVHYANGVLRRKFGLKNATLGHATKGAAIYPKLALAALFKKTGLQKRKVSRVKLDFKLDPNAEAGIVDVEPFVQKRA